MNKGLSIGNSINKCCTHYRLLDFCIPAPVIEEVLMRGFLLEGLSVNYGKMMALIISSMLFALLHFNFR